MAVGAIGGTPLMRFLKGNNRPLTAEDRCAAARLSALSDRAKAGRRDHWSFEEPEASEPLEVRDVLQ